MRAVTRCTVHVRTQRSGSSDKQASTFEASTCQAALLAAGVTRLPPPASLDMSSNNSQPLHLCHGNPRFEHCKLS